MGGMFKTGGHRWDVQDCRTLVGCSGLQEVGCSGLQDIGGMFRTAGGGMFRTAGGGMFRTAGHWWDVQDWRT